MTTLQQAKARYPAAVTFRFGDSAELCAALLDLVRAGKKTATCGRLQDYIDDPAATPVVGRRDIALNWDGTPAIAIETVEVSHCAFRDIAEDFALAEGENDDLPGWRRDHAAYFRRNGGFSPDMMLLCEVFRVVEVFAASD